MTTDDYVAETLKLLPARPVDEGFVGDSPDWFGPTLFGGFVLGQATSALAQTAPDGFRINSLRGYFLSAMRSGVPADYTVDALRDGRSFAHRALTGTQEGKMFVSMVASFAPPNRRSDYEYGRSLDPSVPRPDDLEIESGEDPFDGAWLGPTEPEADGHVASSMRRWTRFARPLPDDPVIRAALFAYMTDMTDMTGQGARPLLMSDEWLFYDLTSTINTSGRGYLRGQIHTEDGTHVATVTQETLIWDPSLI